MDEEIWAPLTYKGVKDMYFVSNYGRIKNLKGHIMRPWKDRDGYLRYTLQDKHGHKIKVLAHRAVCYHFIDGCDFTDREVNHKNGVKDDNYIGNLEVVTHQENIDHSVRNKFQTFVSCEQHGYATLTNDDVEAICHLLFDWGFSVRDTRDIMCMTKGIPASDVKKREKLRGVIKHIKSGKTWKPISSKYINR